MKKKFRCIFILALLLINHFEMSDEEMDTSPPPQFGEEANEEAAEVDSTAENDTEEDVEEENGEDESYIEQNGLKKFTLKQ